ncbi:uncharacterized protein IL334_002861 [Kwoniella shivajii]|uniref:Uncharacterized protein n=1 Tax=Kwoniella shivajii TaxID=564305 RepID=A0ABZ1CW96_9TREE|nr:hypothetical protein IL334_002861 [Kwoniella shivajii]
MSVPTRGRGRPPRQSYINNNNNTNGNNGGTPTLNLSQNNNNKRTSHVLISYSSIFILSYHSSTSSQLCEH